LLHVIKIGENIRYKSTEFENNISFTFLNEIIYEFKLEYLEN